MANEIKKMLSQALIDLKAAGISFLSSKPMYEEVYYHCQISIMKSMLAYILFKDSNFNENLNLKELTEKLKTIDIDFEEICNQILENKFCTNEKVNISCENIKQFILIAEKLFQKVIEKIPVEVLKT